MATPLDNYPTVRQWIYNIYWVVGVVLGSLQVWFTAKGASPTWLSAGMQVYAYAGTAIGFLAAANITKSGG